MTTKEKMFEAVSALPDDAGIEEAMETLFFLAKIEKGMERSDSGQTLSHEEVSRGAIQ